MGGWCKGRHEGGLKERAGVGCTCVWEEVKEEEEEEEGREDVAGGEGRKWWWEGGWLRRGRWSGWKEGEGTGEGGGISGAELQTVSPALALVREPLTITCSTRTDASASWRAHATLEQEPKRSETAAVQHQAPEDDLNQSTKKTRKTKNSKQTVCAF